MEKLILLTKALQTPIGAGPDMVINSAIPGPSTNLESISRSMLNRIQLYKSKISKSK